MTSFLSKFQWVVSKASSGFDKSGLNFVQYLYQGKGKRSEANPTGGPSKELRGDVTGEKWLLFGFPPGQRVPIRRAVQKKAKPAGQVLAHGPGGYEKNPRISF